MKNNDVQVSASEFKKHFLSLVDQVKNNNNSFIITKRKIPIARVVPLNTNIIEEQKSLFGFMKGRAKINGDIINYSSEKDWEVNND